MKLWSKGAPDDFVRLLHDTREEAEQLDREGRYTTAIPPGTLIDTCRCLQCGALVGDRTAHDSWHASLGG